MQYNYAKIRSWGDKNTATTHDGDIVTRQPWYFEEEWGIITCIPYELHFIYKDPHSEGAKAIKYRWAYMCTCGSPAGIVAYSAMSGMITAEKKGFVLCCMAHTASKANTGIGRHADGSTE